VKAKTKPTRIVTPFDWLKGKAEVSPNLIPNLNCMIKVKADVDLRDANDSTTLHLVAKEGHVKLMKYLLGTYCRIESIQ